MPSDSPLFPAEQKWGHNKRLYWFWSFREHTTLWRYDTYSRADIQRLSKGNYFHQEKDALRYGKAHDTQQPKKRRCR